MKLPPVINKLKLGITVSVLAVIISCEGNKEKKEKTGYNFVWDQVFKEWESKQYKATFYYTIEDKTDTIYKELVDWKKETEIFRSIEIPEEELNNFEQKQKLIKETTQSIFKKKGGKLPVVSLSIAEEKTGRIFVKGKIFDENRLYSNIKHVELDSEKGYVIQIIEQNILGKKIKHRVEVKLKKK